MTKKEFLRSELLKRLKPEFALCGFILNKSFAEFTQRNSDGWNKLQLVFLDRREFWEINLGLLIRFNAVENIFHRTSGFEERYQKGTSTIQTTLEEYVNVKRMRFELEFEEHIDDLAVHLIELFIQVALPFFNKHSTLEGLDSAVNDNPDPTRLSGPIFKGHKGMILAKLTQRKNYHELAGKYTAYLKNFDSGFHLQAFEKLLKDLDTILLAVV